MYTVVCGRCIELDKKVTGISAGCQWSMGFGGVRSAMPSLEAQRTAQGQGKRALAPLERPRARFEAMDMDGRHSALGLAL